MCGRVTEVDAAGDALIQFANLRLRKWVVGDEKALLEVIYVSNISCLKKSASVPRPKVRATLYAYEVPVPVQAHFMHRPKWNIADPDALSKAVKNVSAQIAVIPGNPSNIVASNPAVGRDVSLAPLSIVDMLRSGAVAQMKLVQKAQPSQPEVVEAADSEFQMPTSKDIVAQVEKSIQENSFARIMEVVRGTEYYNKDLTEQDVLELIPRGLPLSPDHPGYLCCSFCKSKNQVGQFMLFPTGNGMKNHFKRARHDVRQPQATPAPQQPQPDMAARSHPAAPAQTPLPPPPVRTKVPPPSVSQQPASYQQLQLYLGVKRSPTAAATSPPTAARSSDVHPPSKPHKQIQARPKLKQPLETPPETPPPPPPQSEPGCTSDIIFGAVFQQTTDFLKKLASSLPTFLGSFRAICRLS
ncbi:unnamed protein product [Symbiodinium sp. KB8]|nr:unnamed protein product [Symbiodinium sp. KB8]